MSRSTNHRDTAGDPEVWFRITHITIDSRDTGYRKQTVEVGLGPKNDFKTSNVGALTRRVRSDRVVSAALPRRHQPRPQKKPKTPRVTELLRQAIEWQALLESGEATSQAEIARRQGLSRARVTQVLAMLSLAPEIQQCILSLPGTVGRIAITERALRPLTRINHPRKQLAAFSELVRTTLSRSLTSNEPLAVIMRRLYRRQRPRPR